MSDARSDTTPADWASIWQILAELERRAKHLRHLSQYEPLAQPTPGYPRAGTHRRHDGEVREALEGIVAGLEALHAALPGALPQTLDVPGIAEDEQPRAVGPRLDALIRLTSGLREQAFQPVPPLPPHSPPYLFEPPGHDLAGTKAVSLAIGIERLTAAIRNAMIARANGL